MTDALDPEVTVRQAAYYGGLMEAHGAGVDAVASGRMEYKELRYERLCRVFGEEDQFSVHDVGFGLGHLRDHLRRRYADRTITWSGSEVTPAFVEHLRGVEPGIDVHLRDLASSPGPERYDYVLLAGTFYHLAGADPREFEAFFRSLLGNCWSMCRRGLAFNLVTDAVGYRVDDLFYPDLGEVIDVVRGLTRFFEIDHATPLYEYTVRLHREEALSEQFADQAYDRYLADRRAAKDPPRPPHDDSLERP